MPFLSCSGVASAGTSARNQMSQIVFPEASCTCTDCLPRRFLIASEISAGGALSPTLILYLPSPANDADQSAKGKIKTATPKRRIMAMPQKLSPKHQRGQGMEACVPCLRV